MERKIVPPGADPCGDVSSHAATSSEPSAAFTPGPWVTHPHWPSYVIPAAHADRPLGGHADDAEDLRRYAQVIVSGHPKDRHRSTEEVHANARLIAAAPDLYEALRDAAATLYAVDIAPIPYADERLWLRVTETRRAVGAALAKAEGR